MARLYAHINLESSQGVSATPGVSDVPCPDESGRLKVSSQRCAEGMLLYPAMSVLRFAAYVLDSCFHGLGVLSNSEG